MHHVTAVAKSGEAAMQLMLKHVLVGGAATVTLFMGAIDTVCARHNLVKALIFANVFGRREPYYLYCYSFLTQKSIYTYMLRPLEGKETY
jgi:hypothetical protein